MERIKESGVFCGQDLREFIGYRVVDVRSDELDSHVRIGFEDRQGNRIWLHIADGVLDGESMWIRKG